MSSGGAIQNVVASSNVPAYVLEAENKALKNELRRFSIYPEANEKLKEQIKELRAQNKKSSKDQDAATVGVKKSKQAEKLLETIKELKKENKDAKKRIKELERLLEKYGYRVAASATAAVSAAAAESAPKKRPAASSSGTLSASASTGASPAKRPRTDEVDASDTGSDSDSETDDDDGGDVDNGDVDGPSFAGAVGSSSAAAGADGVIVPATAVKPSKPRAPRRKKSEGDTASSSASAGAGVARVLTRTLRSPSFFFKPEHDARLTEGKQLYGDEWDKVAKHVGENITSKQCKQRWINVVDPERKQLRNAWKWTSAQDVRLAMAVGVHGRAWVKVAEYLGGGVSSDMCYDRWSRYVDPNVTKKPPRTPWTPEKDTRLLDALKLFGKKWTKIAEYVGGGVSSFQCSQHYNAVFDPDAIAKKPKNRPWTEEEDKTIEELVEKYKGLGKRGGIEWKAIAKVLDRTVVDCSGRWPTIQGRKMKNGPYTDEETEQLLQLVEEHAGAKGKWNIIGQLMGRGRDSVFGRYRTLKQRDERERELEITPV